MTDATQPTVEITLDGARRAVDGNLRAIINADRNFAAQIEAGAKALAWSKLTDLGRRTFDWIHEFSETERTDFRATALIVLQATRGMRDV